jgi:uncharacterized protein (TIGR03905 family)
MYEYETNGTCSTKIHFDIKDGKLRDVNFEKGCNGNLKAIGALVEGMGAVDAVKKLKGIHCGKKNTSCGDQLAKAIEKFL